MNKNPLIDEVRLLLEKATQEKDEGNLLLREGYSEGAINRFYYSAFHIAKAILHLFGENPKTHAGTIQRFSLLAVDRKEFDKQYAKTLADLFRAREAGDYTLPSLLDLNDANQLKDQFLEYEREIRDKIQTILDNM